VPGAASPTRLQLKTDPVPTDDPVDYLESSRYFEVALGLFDRRYFLTDMTVAALLPNQGSFGPRVFPSNTTKMNKNANGSYEKTTKDS
jgi:hypothetical protein